MPETWGAVARRLGEWHGVLPRYHAGGKDVPDIDLWGVLRKWIAALPAESEETKTQKLELSRELETLETGLKGVDGGVGLVTGHCDLLNGNVIVLPGGGERAVHLIDYEYATPCERAFDIANHFAEWGGFECDYSKLPTRCVRREFIRVYLRSFHQHRGDGVEVQEEEVEKLMGEVDLFRGVPGFYWYVTLNQVRESNADVSQGHLGVDPSHHLANRL